MRCRLAVAVQGWCNVECEDQLQHTISVHLHSEYASDSVDMAHVKKSLLLANHSAPADQAAATYFHLQLADLIEKYDKQQQERKWFDVYNF